MKFVAIVTALAAGVDAQISDRYTAVATGGCRGNGGASDHVNSKYEYGFTQNECEGHCDSLDTCVGYAYQTGGQENGQQNCIIYGPGVAGSCSDANQDTKEKCWAAGSCSDPSVFCTGASGRGEGTNCVGIQTLCDNVGGIWYPASAVWTEPESPWNGEPTTTTHIHTGNGNADFTCYDLDLDDHQATCTNEITYHSGLLECADSWTSPTDGGSCAQEQNGCPAEPCNNDNDTVSWCCNKGSEGCDDWHYCACERDFEAADTYAEEDCDVAAGCVYTAAPVMETVVVPHAGDELNMGSTYLHGQSGACRGSDENGAQVGLNSKYANSCDASGTKVCGGVGEPACDMTQAECEAGCAAENARSPGACVAYHHGSHDGAWCSVFGPTLHEGIGTDVPEADACWFGNPYDAVEFTGTNVNIQYLCFVTCGGAGQPVCPEEDSDAAAKTALKAGAAALGAAALLL